MTGALASEDEQVISISNDLKGTSCDSISSDGNGDTEVEELWKQRVTHSANKLLTAKVCSHITVIEPFFVDLS